MTAGAGQRAGGADPTATPPVPASGLLTPRGETSIAPRVVEKIATRAASEVDGVGGVVGAGLGRLLPWVTSEGRPRAGADVDQESVSVDISVHVRYPEPLVQVTDRLRRHLIERLGALTGLTVTEVNITVDRLVLPERGAGPRVQ